MTPEQQALDALLKEALSWRSLDKQTVLKRLNIPPDKAVAVQHARLGILQVIENPTKHPAEFSFQGEKLVLITLGRPPLLDRYSDGDLFAILSGTPTRLRSSYGKASPRFVYPELGVSFTTRYEDAHKIQYIELFEPRSLESYKQTLYEEPPTPTPGSLE